MEGMTLAGIILTASTLCICRSDIQELKPKKARYNNIQERKYSLSSSSSSSSRCDLILEKGEADCSEKQLVKIPDDLPPNINTLDLNFNKIPALLNESFCKYTSLTKLILSENKLRYVELRSLHPLTKLTEIDLNENYNLVLTTGEIFRFSKHLSIIRLRSCRLKYIPHNFLKWTTDVSLLDMSSNNVDRVNITSCGTTGKLGTFKLLGNHQLGSLTPEYFKLPCKIDNLYIDANRMLTINPDIITNMDVKNIWVYHLTEKPEIWNNLFIGIRKSTIQGLSLEFPRVDKVNASVFDILRNKSLYSLNLLWLDTEIPLYPRMFAGLNIVTYLRLTCSGIKSVDPEYFSGMEALERLDLRSNGIVSINAQPNYSNWTTDLKELVLAYNELREIHQYTFSGLENLTFLDLYANRILSRLEITSFSHLLQLQCLNVSETMIQHLELYVPLLRSFSFMGRENVSPSPFQSGKIFKYTRLLEIINIRSSIEADPYIFTTLTLFEGLQKLQILDLSDNVGFDSWRILSFSIFQDSTSMTELYLSNCGISTSLGNATFKGLHFLRILDLSRNQISTISPDVFLAVGNLQKLDLSSNLLVAIDEMAFSNLTVLTELIIRENKLVFFNHSIFMSIKHSLISIDLSENPIHCSCEITWLLNFLKGSIIVLHEKQIVCSSSSLKSLQGKPLLMFNPDEICHGNIIALCLIPIVVLATAMALVIVHHNRWWFRFKFFLLKLAILGYREIQDARAHREFEFDLNIMFIDNDEEWIGDHLRPFLEERLPDFNRVVFGDEDLILGMHILEAVDYVVQRSYKTVVLFSRRAVLDNWFLIKFRTAVDHVTDVQMENLVVIFLEDIPDEELPFLVRLYLSDRRPHLLWVEDEEGQEYFWKELLKDLTINLKRNNLIPPE